jgi:archaellum biogenesis protein FlaJ (TadC family)
MTSFNLSGLEVMHSLVIPLVIIFTIANAIAPSLADGGSKYKIMFNVGVTAGISGIALLILPSLAGALFQSAQM